MIPAQLFCRCLKTTLWALGDPETLDQYQQVGSGNITTPNGSSGLSYDHVTQLVGLLGPFGYGK